VGITRGQKLVAGTLPSKWSFPVPSQVIHLPVDIFAALFDRHTEIAAALPPEKIEVTASGTHTPASLDFWMRRGEVIEEASSATMVPALVVVPEGGTFSFWPQLLSDHEVRTMLDTVEHALTSASGLTGHEGMVIGEAVEQARHAPSTGARPVTPLPEGSPWQQRLLANAQMLTRQFADEFGALDSKLTSYRARNVDADMDRVIVRLDAHAHLGQRLRLRTRADGRFVAELTAESRYGSLREAISAAQALEQAALHAHHYFNPFGYPPDPDIGTLGWLNRSVRGAAWKFNSYEEFRTDDQPASSLVGKLALPRAIPAEAVPAALVLWLDDMQPGRWPDVHPFVQAAFALTELIAIRPFRIGNGRFARILFAENLRSRGFPVLPWNTAIELRFERYRAAVRNAINIGSHARLVAFLIDVYARAIEQADRVIAVAEPERLKFTLALEHRELDGVAIGRPTARALSEDLLGGVLVEGFTPKLQFVPMRSLFRDLAAKGLLDLVATPHGTWASVPAIRRLMSCDGQASPRSAD
jgi:hypothetical protein